MAKPVRLRELAATDVERAAERYRNEAGLQTALAFVDAVERAMGRVGRCSGIGSPRFAYEVAIPGLRAWPVARFPYTIFYLDAADVLDVWRVLHSRRDIPAVFREP